MEQGERKLVVSLHDVSPLTRPIFELMLAELRELGVERCSLLVIPDHHHRGHFLKDASFCHWLESMARLGHELVLHGYYHQRAPRSVENWRQRLMTRVYTKGEGEFYDLSKEEAADKLARGKEAMARLDAPAPTGFIAPAWLLSEAASDAVGEAGFHYTTYLTGVKHYAVPGGGDDEFIPSRSLVYSPRNRWRRVTSLGYVAALAKYLAGAPLLRFGLHPPDWQHQSLRSQARRIVAAALRDRQAVTYGEFVGGRGG